MRSRSDPGRPARAGLNSLRAAEHVGFTVRDLERSVIFYSALLGQPPFFRRNEGRPYLGEIVGYPGCKVSIAFFHLPRTKVFLELLEYHHPSGQAVSMETCNPGNGHLCITVDDLESEFDRFIALGATPRQARPVDRTDGGRAAYLRDPDGITIELQEPP